MYKFACTIKNSEGNEDCFIYHAPCMAMAKQELKKFLSAKAYKSLVISEMN